MRHPLLDPPRAGAHQVHTRKLRDPEVRREISIVTRRGRSLSPAGQAFVDLARRAIASSKAR